MTLYPCYRPQADGRIERKLTLAIQEVKKFGRPEPFWAQFFSGFSFYLEGNGGLAGSLHPRNMLR
jgi:hypothetical protein